MEELESRRQFLSVVGRVIVAGSVITFLDACGSLIARGAVPSPTAAAATPLPGVGVGQGAAPISSPSLPGEIAITPNADFYTVASASERPDVPPDWNLVLDGNVERSLTKSLDELKSLPAVEEMRTLNCISNPAGGTLISNANWKGFRLKDLLDLAKLGPGTVELKFGSFDGYTTSIPLALALDDHSLLVYEMNGEPLPIEHGKPLRCLWPGRYGMKQPKWLTHITAITGTYRGYWEQQGWSNDAFIRPFSRIDSPADNSTVKGKTWEVRGIGYSGEEGIAKIELSLDNGKTWAETELLRGPSTHVWTQWSWGGPLPPNGDYTLYARVTTNKGETQGLGGLGFLSATFPNGTSDMQPIVVSVISG